MTFAYAVAMSSPPTTAFSIEFAIERHDIDSLGHVNNAAYVRFFETGRIDLYRRIGLKLGPGHQPRLGTVVVNLNVNFRAECFEGDKLRLLTSALRRGRRSFVIGHHLLDGECRTVADGETTCVVMNLDTREVVDMPPELSRLFSDNTR